MKINVIGLGYMGYPLACLLAKAGHEVLGVDISQKRVDEINNGIIPFEEKGLEALVTSIPDNSLSASTKPLKAEVHIVSVPTPHKGGKCDLSYVWSALESLADIVEAGNLVIVESTIYPGVSRSLKDKFFAGKDVFVAHCPERAIPGDTLRELVENDRIVGGLTPDATEKAAKVYRSFVTGEVLETSAEVAEASKLLENTFRDVNIALANEFDQILREKGVDSKEAIRLANRHPRVNILEPGIGVGGHCIAVDPWFLIQDVESAPLIKTARTINDTRPKVIAERIASNANGKKKLGILGVTYKPNVDDIRETPVIEVKAFDPHYSGEFPFTLTSTFDELFEWADEVYELVNHEANMKLRKEWTSFTKL